MSLKKQIRKEFREAVLARDKYCCRCCGAKGQDRQLNDNWKKFHKRIDGLVMLDAHHIIDRSEIINQGYCAENGISVCDECHVKAEKHHQTGEAEPGFSPDELFALIGSSKEKAIKASENICF